MPSSPAVSATYVTLLDSDSVEEKTPPSEPSPSSLEEQETPDPEVERADEKDNPRREDDRFRNNGEVPGLDKGDNPAYGFACPLRGEGDLGTDPSEADKLDGVGEKTSVSVEGTGRRGVGGMTKGEARSVC